MPPVYTAVYTARMSSQPSIATALSAAEVRKLATLARLELAPDDIERYRTELSAILGYAQRLSAVDLADIEPMAHIGDLTTRLDDDVPGPMLGNDTLMNLAPRTIPPFILVPRVLGEGGGA